MKNIPALFDQPPQIFSQETNPGETAKREHPSAGKASAPTLSGDRPQTTHLITRGTYRFLCGLDYTPLCEFKLASGRRADLVAINAKGHIIMVEVKSCAADFSMDQKWTDYIGFCDGFYFAVAPDFPVDLLPASHGLIIADAYGAMIKRPATERKLVAARRKALTLRIARQSLARLQAHSMI